MKGMGMRTKYGWLVALLAITLLVAACGPEMASPTPEEVVAVANTPADPATEAVDEEPQDEEPAAAATEVQGDPTEEPESAQEPEEPVQSDDWHILGSPDAPVTIVDFSDFQ
jgi:hypothetical protein